MTKSNSFPRINVGYVYNSKNCPSSFQERLNTWDTMEDTTFPLAFVFQRFLCFNGEVG